MKGFTFKIIDSRQRARETGALPPWHDYEWIATMTYKGKEYYASIAVHENEPHMYPEHLQELGRILDHYIHKENTK